MGGEFSADAVVSTGHGKGYWVRKTHGHGTLHWTLITRYPHTFPPEDFRVLLNLTKFPASRPPDPSMRPRFIGPPMGPFSRMPHMPWFGGPRLREPRHPSHHVVTTRSTILAGLMEVITPVGLMRIAQAGTKEEQ